MEKKEQEQALKEMEQLRVLKNFIRIEAKEGFGSVNTINKLVDAMELDPKALQAKNEEAF